MENELRDFFLTVANYPLPENAEKYIEAMKNIPETASHYDYVKWLRYGFERRQGRERIEGFFYPTNDPRVYSLFTDEDFKSFERNRALLISVLNQIFSGADFFWNERFSKISGYANSLQSREFFGISSTTAGTVLRKIKYDPKMDDAADELEEVFAFACYGLISFLADSRQGGRDRIKKCAQCRAFFFQARNDERNRFCSDDCRNLHNQEQRKTDEGKAQRAAYMRRWRADLRKRERAKKRADKLKRLMDGGHTRKQAEKWLNETDV